MEDIFNSAAILESTGKTVKVKNFADTYLYNKGSYEKGIFDYLMHSKYIDKSTESFKELVDTVKHQRISSALSKIITSPKTVLCINEVAMPRSFKVFVGKDLRSNSSELKLFIDVTDIIKEENGELQYNNNGLHILISYLLAGMIMMIYYADPTRITSRNAIVESGARCFSDLLFFIIDYLRLSSDTSTRDKVKYMAAKYFQLCLLNMDYTEAVENRAAKISNISQTNVSIIDLNLSKMTNPYENIETFTKALSAVLHTEQLSVELLLEKWMFHIGSGTQFSLELFTVFAANMIYAYQGVYINHQKTIEKAAGRDMVEFVSELYKLGNEVIK